MDSGQIRRHEQVSKSVFDAIRLGVWHRRDIGDAKQDREAMCFSNGTLWGIFLQQGSCQSRD